MINQNQSAKTLGAITYQEGWQCPVCKAVMAPWKPSCINCTGTPQLTITPLTPDITLLENISISGDTKCSN